MEDIDKVIAAIFAASMCHQSTSNKHEDYLAQYEIFLTKIREREHAENSAIIETSDANDRADRA